MKVCGKCNSSNLILVDSLPPLYECLTCDAILSELEDIKEIPDDKVKMESK